MCNACFFFKYCSLFELLRVKDDSDVNPLKDLIEKMPDIAERVLDRFVKYSDHPPNHPDFTMTFDFRLLEHERPPMKGRRRGERFFAPTTMAEFQRERLLMHPLSQMLLQWKWFALGKFVYWVDFLSFLVFLVIFTHFLVTERSKQYVFDPSDDLANPSAEDEKLFKRRTTFTQHTPVAITVFICFHMAKELYQLAILRSRYLHLTNLFEWSCYILSLLVVLPYLMGKNVYFESGMLWPLASMALLLAYSCCILFLRRFSYFGLYITMFIEVFKTLIRALSVFVLFISAFALAFFILLKEQVSTRTAWTIA